MAKDPATLWYWSDWNSGTVTFSRHLKGCYIDLLHAQFNNGHLSLDEIKTVLGVDFSNWNTLQKKFVKDENGGYYNKRLEEEINKRKAFSESRRNNRKKKTCLTSDITSEKDMYTHMENENRNDNDMVFKEGGGGGTNLEPLAERKSKFHGPDFGEVKYFFVDMNNRPLEEAATFWNEYEGKEWWVHNKEGTPSRKMKTGRDWQLKAEQWIYKSRLSDVEKKKNGTGKKNNTDIRKFAKGSTSVEDINAGLDKAFGKGPAGTG